MSKPKSSFGRTFLWGVLCIGLAIAVVGQLTSDNDIRSPTPTKDATGVEVAFEKTVFPADLPPLSEFDETIERPLFHPTRRPVLPAAAAAQPDRPPPSLPRGYSLRGIVVTPAGRTALFQTQKDKEYLRVKQGETIEGWTVDEINPDHVVVRQNNVVEIWEFVHEPARPASRTVQRQSAPRLASPGGGSVGGATESGRAQGAAGNQVPAPSQEGQPIVTK